MSFNLALETSRGLLHVDKMLIKEKHTIVSGYLSSRDGSEYVEGIYLIDRNLLVLKGGEVLKVYNDVIDNYYGGEIWRGGFLHFTRRASIMNKLLSPAAFIYHEHYKVLHPQQNNVLREIWDWAQENGVKLFFGYFIQNSNWFDDGAPFKLTGYIDYYGSPDDNEFLEKLNEDGLNVTSTVSAIKRMLDEVKDDKIFYIRNEHDEGLLRKFMKTIANALAETEPPNVELPRYIDTPLNKVLFEEVSRVVMYSVNYPSKNRKYSFIKENGEKGEIILDAEQDARIKACLLKELGFEVYVKCSKEDSELFRRIISAL